MKTTTEIIEIIEIIKSRNRFLITSHMDPDGDSIGSQLALYHILRSLGKEAMAVNQGAMPSKYKFLDPDGIIRFSGSDLPFVPEVVFLMECPSPERIGFVRSLIPESAFTVNIDHHKDNTEYGDINLVDAVSGAAAEILYFIFHIGGFEITPEMAKQLYAALASDTGRFRFSSTTARSMMVASRLIELGADPKYISDRLYADFSPETMRLLGTTLSGLRLEADGKIGYLVITLKDLMASGAGIENSEGFVDFIQSINGVNLGFLFKELPSNEVKVSVRSQNGFDSARFASIYNGGGHTNAAGFMRSGNLDEIIKDVVARAAEFINGD